MLLLLLVMVEMERGGAFSARNGWSEMRPTRQCREGIARDRSGALLVISQGRRLRAT